MAGPRRLAIVTACATFVLLLIGGLVHNTRSSLACPDWPLCFGSAFPKMVGGVAYEHSHRLAATTVGVLTVALAVLLGMRRKVGLGLIGVGLVVFQGVLGGITVIYRLPTLVSTSHLGVSLVFFIYLIWLSFRLREGREAVALSGRLRSWILAAGVLVYVQSLVGALMRHLGAGLACVDVPLCRGRVWPGGEHPSVLLHAGHRLIAVAAGIVVIGVAVALFRAGRERGWVRALAVGLAAVVLAQIGLGVASIVTFLDALPVTAHLGGAAALLAGLACARFATSGSTVTVAGA